MQATSVKSTTEAEDHLVISVEEVSHHYRGQLALDQASLSIKAGQLAGFIGPDGSGKSTLMGLIAGAKVIQQGRIRVLGGDLRSQSHRNAICDRIAYMPEGLGKNLYAELTVVENLTFFARLLALPKGEYETRIERLLAATGLTPFSDRPAGKLSGGMKQKLGLCCALIRNPDLLLLDEPTTGVDPLSRQQFWKLIEEIRQQRPEMSVLVSTAYMDEAEDFDHLVAIKDGSVLAAGRPNQLLEETQSETLEEAFVRLLPEVNGQEHERLSIPERDGDEHEPIIVAEELTKTFGDFTAVDRVSFEIHRGEIFGFLGSNGCGKTTTMKMLTGLLPATSGRAELFGESVDGRSLKVRHRVGYMSQSFSLYNELTVQQNLWLHARLFHLPRDERRDRIGELLDEFQLEPVADELAARLPLGLRQRLSLAVAIIHRPQILILDEPTSGVDPLARDRFWQLLIDLSRDQKVTIFISTHFVNEGQRCDRVSLMHAGKVLAADTPQALVKSRGADDFEEAFIGYLRDAVSEEAAAENSTAQNLGAENSAAENSGSEHSAANDAANEPTKGGQESSQSVASQPSESNRDAGNRDAKNSDAGNRDVGNKHAGNDTGDDHDALVSADEQARPESSNGQFRFSRLLAYAHRESLEIRRDPVRLAFAFLGSVCLMIVFGFGITMDVDEMDFAVLDQDRSPESVAYAEAMGGSRYFDPKPVLRDRDEAIRRLRGNQISVAVEFPPDFGRDLRRGDRPSVSFLIDGADPSRAATVESYVEGFHRWYLQQWAEENGASLEEFPAVEIQPRFWYNPTFESIYAMVPSIPAILLIFIPAILMAVSVVKEKELGSIINFYATPSTRLEFLLGKQLPYIAIGFLNFIILTVLSVSIFDVGLRGNVPMFAACAIVYVTVTTGIGLVISSFTSSQVAAVFVTTVLTILPTIQFSGLLQPVSTLEGMGRWIGTVWPTTYYMHASVGTFTKGLSAGELLPDLLALLAFVPVLTFLAVITLPKQEPS